MNVKSTILVTGLALAGIAGHADEKTGREFSELVRKMNKELAAAKVQVRKVDEAYRNKYPAKPKAMLPKRKTSLEALRELSKELNDTENAEKRKELEAKVQDQVIKVAEVSADFLEYNKDQLINQDKQMEIMESALANVILKLDRMKELTSSNNAKAKAEFKQQRIEARRELRSMALVVEMFAKKSPKSHHWQGVRQTILLQDAVLRKSMADNSKLYDMLATQKQVYELTHAQIVLARQGIAEERKLLSQVALGEVARSMLRKAAGLLLGDFRVENVGMAAMARSEGRQKSLMAFLDQDYEIETGSGKSANENKNGVPDGYDAFLKSDIN